jgi:hypothetical protein
MQFDTSLIVLPTEQTKEEAVAAIMRRNRWCQLALKASWRARLSNWLSRLPVFSFLGEPITTVYALKHPNEPWYMPWYIKDLLANKKRGEK